jgi:phosphoglucosamine mutase
MKPRKFFGTDGIRGRVGSSLVTPELCMKLGYAAGKVLSKRGTRRVLIGKDTRISGYMLESALESGFAAAGVTVELTGPMPTPAIAYLTKTFRAEAGVVISASHNPYYDNGIKFFSENGEKLTDAQELEIEALMEQDIECVSSNKLGKAIRLDDAQGRYIEYCKSNFPNKYSLEGLKIVIDSANGAAYKIAGKVFNELGANVVNIFNTPNGKNINENCGATNTNALQKAVIDHSADLGIALDGDADRLMMVDHFGNEINGDELVYIIAMNDHESGRLRGGVVGTIMSNIGLQNALAEQGIEFARSNVGDRHVMKMMREKGWSLGAESSGHIINLNHNSTGDGIIAALNVLTAVVKSGKKLAQLRQGITLQPQVLVNVEFNKTDPLVNDLVKGKISMVESAIKGKGRVLIRKSGTEPLIRIMIEGNSKEEALMHANDIATVMKKAS